MLSSTPLIGLHSTWVSGHVENVMHFNFDKEVLLLFWHDYYDWCKSAKTLKSLKGISYHNHCRIVQFSFGKHFRVAEHGGTYFPFGGRYIMNRNDTNLNFPAILAIWQIFWFSYPLAICFLRLLVFLANLLYDHIFREYEAGSGKCHTSGKERKWKITSGRSKVNRYDFL